jgi:hypothetical protein
MDSQLFINFEDDLLQTKYKEKIMWLVDCTLIILLIINIILCVKLRRSVNVIRNNRGYFARMLNEFNEATNKARESIEELKSLNNESTSSLKNYIAQAQETTEELSCLKDVANNTIRRLEKLTPEDEDTDENVVGEKPYARAKSADKANYNQADNTAVSSSPETTQLSRSERTKNNISDILDRLSSNNLSESNDNNSQYGSRAGGDKNSISSRFNRLRRSS